MVTEVIASSTPLARATGDAFGICVVVVILVLCGITTWKTTVAANGWMSGKGLGLASVNVLSALAALVTFLGGWLIVDVLWVIRRASRLSVGRRSA